MESDHDSDDIVYVDDELIQQLDNE